MRTPVDTRFERPVYARLRRLCLSFPDTDEAVAWGHPNFRVVGRTFCTFEILRGRPTVAMKASPADVKRLSQSDDFVVTPYGRSMFVSQWLDGAINWRRLETLVKRSYKLTTKETQRAQNARRRSRR
ncbi:MAG TPA: MmcQ/YjbR family DNA-binding protein [Vicinamibacterales bacterium]|nr:MmcQ/YjbR family DNA-binding protein [Vicinamibacterales bacterium]